jgi:hypothetical protein
MCTGFNARGLEVRWQMGALQLCIACLGVQCSGSVEVRGAAATSTLPSTHTALRWACDVLQHCLPLIVSGGGLRVEGSGDVCIAFNAHGFQVRWHMHALQLFVACLSSECGGLGVGGSGVVCTGARGFEVRWQMHVLQICLPWVVSGGGLGVGGSGDVYIAFNAHGFEVRWHMHALRLCILCLRGSNVMGWVGCGRQQRRAHRRRRIRLRCACNYFGISWVVGEAEGTSTTPSTRADSWCACCCVAPVFCLCVAGVCLLCAGACSFPADVANSYTIFGCRCRCLHTCQSPSQAASWHTQNLLSTCVLF